ncbi:MULTISPECIES: DUF6218 family protein [Saccharothrix]|uniref:DUF6218 family protein n=1 Tax=Saccharothrix TaxID=2071 RepID=UPI0011614134|nr:DUF6218 family protein [Saccharothrix sp. CB00851]
MTAEPLEHSALGLLPTRAADGRTMIGHVIVCRAGAGQDDAIAVWHLDTEGSRTGAWVRPAATALTEPETARSLLDLCKRKALLAWDPAGAVRTLRELEQAAGVPQTDWSACAVAVRDLVAEVADIRAAYAKRVAEEKAGKKNIVDLDWAIALPEPMPATAEDFESFARFGELVAPSAAATEALRISRVGGWVVQRWRETVVALGRPYLRATFGPPTVLAPEWETRLADAYAHQR